MSTEMEKKEHETQDQRLEKLKAQRAAEKEEQLAKMLKAAKKAGLTGKALDLYTKAINEKNGYTLIPAGKAPNEKEGTGNHTVEVEMFEGKPIEVDGMIVVCAK
jgi:Tfp pilus assembly PilM family ATPase